MARRASHLFRAKPTAVSGWEGTDGRELQAGVDEAVKELTWRPVGTGFLSLSSEYIHSSAAVPTVKLRSGATTGFSALSP